MTVARYAAAKANKDARYWLGVHAQCILENNTATTMETWNNFHMTTYLHGLPVVMQGLV